jgi:hypothetical protein
LRMLTQLRSRGGCIRRITLENQGDQMTPPGQFDDPAGSRVTV